MVQGPDQFIDTNFLASRSSAATAAPSPQVSPDDHRTGGATIYYTLMNRPAVAGRESVPDGADLFRGRITLNNNARSWPARGTLLTLI